MNLGICGPVETRPLAPFLERGLDTMPPGIGGTPVVELVRAAVLAGRKVTVFSLDPDLQEERIATGPQLKICMGPYRVRRSARDLFASERRYLAAAIEREKPDVVHGHWTAEFALGVLDSGVPSVITAHDRPFRVLRWNFTPYRILKTVAAALVVRRANCLTAVSEPVARHFRRYFLPRSPVHVIPNGLSAEWFVERPAHRCDGPFTFIAVLTGWGPLKNGRMLLRAFAEVRRSAKDVRLRLFGVGHGPGEEAEAHAVRHGLTDGVDFVGHISQALLRDEMLSADALVHPSREESFSMVIAEAMACCLPVIAVRGSGGINDAPAVSQAVLSTDGASASRLAADMFHLASDAALRTRLSEAGRTLARRDFCVSAVLDAYSRLYRCVEAAA